MQRVQDLRLKIAIEIDEEVAAGDEIELGEGRVLQKTMVREKHDVAQLALDAEMIALAGEEPAQPLFADVGLDRFGIAAFARDRKRARVHVGGEDLNLGAE